MVEKSAKVDDPTLISRIRQGDEQAWRQLVSKYRNRVHYFALGKLENWHDADEVAQETFERAFKKILTFRGESKVSTWLFAIAFRLCQNRRRAYAQQKKWIAGSTSETIQTEEGEELAHDVEDLSPDPREVASRNERSRLLREAINKLDNELDRRIIELKDLGELTYREVATLVKKPISTVTSRHPAAWRRLRKILGKMGLERK